MSYMALYRKWRPLIFEDVVEQQHVTQTLKNTILYDRVAHAYLFCGTRGTGKTTMAKIFARAVNCLSPNNGNPCNECEICSKILSNSLLDVIEIDAASNNSVDNIREIRDEVIYTPSQAKYKVYIIDEVHMLSIGAFNALLKTLEEPPKHVIFILATTEPHKLPPTILSRCQKFEFRKIPVISISKRLKEIAEASSVEIEENALKLISKLSDGALRDAISILDQCMSLEYKVITQEHILSVIGIVDSEFMVDFVDAIIDRDIANILRLIEEFTMQGKDIALFTSELILYYRNLLISKISNKTEGFISGSEEYIKKITEHYKKIDRDELIFVIKELSLLESQLKWSLQPRILLEITIIKICEKNYSVNTEDIQDRLGILESKISQGILPAQEEVNKKTITGKGQEKVLSQKQELRERKPVEYNANTKKSNKYLEIWPQVINEIKNMGKMFLYTNLLNSKAIEINEKQVGIILENPTSFGNMLVSKVENVEIIQSILTEKLEREIQIKCLDSCDDQVETNGLKISEESNYVKKIQDAAKNADIPINVIDE